LQPLQNCWYLSKSLAWFNAELKPDDLDVLWNLETLKPSSLLSFHAERIIHFYFSQEERLRFLRAFLVTPQKPDQLIASEDGLYESMVLV